MRLAIRPPPASVTASWPCPSPHRHGCCFLRSFSLLLQLLLLRLQPCHLTGEIFCMLLWEEGGMGRMGEGGEELEREGDEGEGKWRRRQEGEVRLGLLT